MSKQTIQLNKERVDSDVEKHFNLMHKGAQEAIKAFNSGKKLTFDTVILPEPPKEMAAVEIIKLRKKLNASQRVFANFLNVSVKTVQAWEHQQNHPNGASLRLLQLVDKDPAILAKL